MSAGSSRTAHASLCWYSPRGPYEILAPLGAGGMGASGHAIHY